MLPETLSVDIEPARIRRFLRQLLSKLSDIVEEVTLRPSVYRTEPTYGLPPIDPFEHLRCLPKLHKRPRYTYRRRSGYRSAESGNSSDGSDSSVVSAGSKRKANFNISNNSNKRSGARQLTRSASLGSISDSETAARQDPALWLTTPRKRPRHRAPSSSAAAPSMATAKALLHRSQTKPFVQRLEGLISNKPAQPVNAGKAKGLQSLMVHLGESLWLGRPSSADDTGARTRILPLKVMAAFQLGEAIACSDGCDDLDYIDEIYSAIPPFLTRLVLWQHLVVMCYLRIPAYADVLAESLWMVGAFAQQEWLIGARLAGLCNFSDLVDPLNVAPLHLRAIDIGSESRFIRAMLGRLSETRQKLVSSSADAQTMATRSLWYQFVPAGIAAANNHRPTSSDVDSSDEEYSPAAGGVRKRQSHMDAMVPSRYAKWVARISDLTQSTLVLAEALDQALSFILHGTSNADEHAKTALLHQAVDAVRSICSLLYTKLSCGAADTQMLRNSLDMAVSGGLWKSIAALTVFTDRTKTKDAISATNGRSWTDIRQEARDICGIYRFGLALLALRHLRICCGGTAVSEQSWHVLRAKKELTRLGRAELHWICDTANGACEQGPTGGKSRRSMLAAQLNNLIVSAFSTSVRQQPDSPLGLLVLDRVVMPLAVAGASPELFLEIARLVGDTLRCAKVAMAVVDLVVPRFDAIWDHHRECVSWQMDWARLQMAWRATGSAAHQASESDVAAKTCAEQSSTTPLQTTANGNNSAGGGQSAGAEGCTDDKSRARVQRQLVDLADEFERRRRLERAANASSAGAAKADKGSLKLVRPASGSACLSAKAGGAGDWAKEDELALVFLGNRRRSRAKQ
ncbi:hypothetical protein LPJ57_004348 [Coemansia sp. RSA 486]|nr:hypothetical protein LPJ57_004348 [Coemansia sp. RSA 486]